MRATWKFKAIRKDLTGFMVRRSCGVNELTLTDEEALEFSGRIQKFYAEKGVHRVEARSVGVIDLNAPDSVTPRELFRLRLRKDRLGWQADEMGLAHPCWHVTLEEAISYAAFRAQGYLTEIHVFNTENQLMQIVLINQLHNYPRSAMCLHRPSESVKAETVSAASE